ncbi:hypothetical protein [Microbacterium sp.]|uniref:hypothetical protein n=1 Tax=Microbacterium sp. TaxID=51671 RepID=UPI003C726D39
MNTPEFYGATPVKRVRRTNAELAVIDEHILDVLRDEHPATVRSVFYRVMSAGAVEKSENGYRLIGRQLLKLRRDGRIPYGWVSDGTRYTLQTRAYDSASDAITTVASMYRRRIWSTQPEQVQIYSEKDALRAVISPVTNRWDVPLGIMRGYPSESFVYEVANALPLDRHTHLYQLGDHDPSGLDAWRSFEAKVREFNPAAPVTFTRLAVTPEQISTWSLPTRPTKKTDSRSKSFVGGSVEVDAIAPSMCRAAGLMEGSNTRKESLHHGCSP